MKKTDLIAISYDGDLATHNYMAAAERMASTIMGLVEVLANTDPVFCKSMLEQLNAQVTPESLDVSIKDRVEHKEQTMSQLLEGMGDNMMMKFEEEEEEEEEEEPVKETETSTDQ